MRERKDMKKLEAALYELSKDYRDPAEILGPEGLLKQLTKRVLEPGEGEPAEPQAD